MTTGREFGCVCEYHDGRFTVLCGAHLALLRFERDHAISVIEGPIPGFRALAEQDDTHGLRRTTIQTLEVTAKAVRESGELREAMYFVKDKSTER